jgi:hypothetical protein
MRLHIFWLLLAVVPLGCGQASGDQTSKVAYPFVLTPAEVSQARQLAEQDLPGVGLTSGPKIVFIKIDLLPDSQAETAQRLVMVHHYRYLGDETIFTMIDLRTHTVLSREVHAHYPTGLAPSEIEEALHLARSDVRLHTLLATAATATSDDVRPIQYADPQHPWFGHRMVHVMLRQGSSYLAEPRVLVDLTTATVHIDTETKK